MAETLNIISTVSFIASAVFAAFAAVIWFLFNIPVVIGDLSGRNARKSIERMRKNNEAYKPGNAAEIFRKDNKALQSTDTDATQPLKTEAITKPLGEEAATELLIHNAVKSGGRITKLIMIDEKILIHTNEVI